MAIREETKTVYVCSDDTVFDDVAEAVKREAYLHLESGYQGDLVYWNYREEQVPIDAGELFAWLAANKDLVRRTLNELENGPSC